MGFLDRFSRRKNLLAVLGGHTLPVNACAISRGGSYIVSASSDKTRRIWDAGTG